MNSLFRKKTIATIFKTLGLFLALTVCILSCKLFCATNRVSVFGYSFFIIASGSMEPEYPVKTLIILKDKPFDSLKEGDTVVFRSNALNKGLAFHRITRVTENGIYTKGDRNNFEDNQLITESDYIGKEVYSIYSLGAYLYALKTFKGLALYFALPICICFLFIFSLKQFRRYKRV